MQYALAVSLFVRALGKRRVGNPVNRVKYLDSKRIRYQCVAFSVPKKCVANVALRRGGASSTT